MLANKRILLIVGGGIAAFKLPELVRMFRAAGAAVTPVLTRAGAEFVTPLTMGTLAGEEAHTALFDLTKEVEIGHIQLSRAADLVVVAPATADLMAKMATGAADDLASTLLLATDKRVLIAPAMNVRMWEHPATQRNMATLHRDGVTFAGPVSGDMACGEYGPGRMVEPAEIFAQVVAMLREGPLAGKRVVVTSGPTHEPIDPVRYIANRSSGAQGSAIARALAQLGAEVVFVTGPASVPPPEGVQVVRVETAAQMLAAVEAALPADAAVMAAAVADWRVSSASDRKLKKTKDGLPVLEFAENPDILHGVSQMKQGRPPLVVGFAAETNDVIENATAKRLRKGCDWIVANDVSADQVGFGHDTNEVTILLASGESVEVPLADKHTIATAVLDSVSRVRAAYRPQ